MGIEAKVSQNTPPKFDTLHPELMEQVKNLPRKNDVVLHFVDFDDTIAGSLHRFKICPELADNRGDSALPVIAKKF